MTEEFLKKLDWIHNVSCPVCGTKASYVITGPETFNTEGCNHDQFHQIIKERELQMGLEVSD
jgi:hypothetical protein